MAWPNITSETVDRSPLKDKIRNALVEIAQAGVFYEEYVDPDTGFVESIVSNPLTSHRIRCREVSQDFEVDTLSGRRLQAISAWIFELSVSFSVSANDEAFVRALLEIGCLHGFIDMRLQSKRAEHPAQHSADVGTQFVYTLSCTPRAL